MNKNDVLNDLYDVITDRKNNPAEGSYTSYLFDKGLDKILKKIGEECTETVIAAKNDNKDDLIGEICDVIFHLLVMSAEKNVTVDEILDELDIRSKKIGNLKKFNVTDKNS